MNSTRNSPLDTPPPHSTNKELEITQVSITKSNGSIGPRDVPKFWVKTRSNEAFKKLADRVVKESKINGKYSFKDYFKLAGILEPMKSEKPNPPQAVPSPETDSYKKTPSGSSHYSTEIYFNNGKTIKLNSNLHFSSPFDELIKLTYTED